MKNLFGPHRDVDDDSLDIGEYSPDPEACDCISIVHCCRKLSLSLDIIRLLLLIKLLQSILSRVILTTGVSMHMWIGISRKMVDL